MKLNEYQDKAQATAHNSPDLGFAVYQSLALAGEAGEIANKVKKIHRDKGGEFESSDYYDIADELGDALWYLSDLAQRLGFTLENIATRNLGKVKKKVFPNPRTKRSE